jgi:uncharacterized protein YyaL (SSP411 family)
MPFKNAYPTLLWLKDSFDATNRRGSSAYFSLLRHWKSGGWAAAYPETTGYIIETFLDYYEKTGEQWLLDYAIEAAEWLCTLQKENGALPGGLGENGEESVFNTGMMLFGLNRAYLATNKVIFKNTIEKAVCWLMSILENDFSWKKGAYTKNYVPTYYTRVVWAVLESNKILQNADIQENMIKALAFYKEFVNVNHSIKNWAFEPQKPAYTHTIAYAQRGFLECGNLLNDQESIQIAKNIALKISELFEKDGKIAGSYDECWTPDHNYICLTGNAQLSLNAARLFEVTQDDFYFLLAKKIFKTVENAPSRLPLKGYRGGIAGSYPAWGDYRKMSYPNWAAKFWLDAYLKVNGVENGCL